METEIFRCPVCLDFLQTPVSLPCGHNYCLKCVQEHWDTEEEQRLYACPQCAVSISPRPVLSQNLLLAASVEQRSTAPPVAPSHTLQETMCPEHHQVKTMFCRFDQQLICVLCCEDQHHDHETVSSASERAQRQAQLEAQRHLLLQNLQLKDTELSSLQQQEQDIRTSAHTALQLSRDSFRDMILLLETRAKEVEQQIQAEEERALSRVREIQDQVQQDLRELKKSLCDLDTLSLTKDHNSFLQLHTALASHSQGPVPVKGPSEGTVPARVHRSPFEEVSRAVSELRERLQLTAEEELSNICSSLNRVQYFLTEPRSRDGFLQFSIDFTLDPNTANTWLSLSDDDRTATVLWQEKEFPDHQDRFRDVCQVLSRESVSGGCYWEVEVSSADTIAIAVSYRGIPRKDSDNCSFGSNDKSWALHCNDNSFFCANRRCSRLLGPVGPRVGVFLDHSAGVLSFYSVSEDMRLIHREQTTFSQPLHAGVTFTRFFLFNDGDSAHFPKVK